MPLNSEKDTRPQESNLPFISVIIPVKNGAAALPACLASLKHQDYPSNLFEVIIADGLSTDNTVDVALQYGAKVVSNELQTVAPGRNVGYSISGGEIVVFSDDDCVMDGRWLRNSVKYFQDASIGGITGPTMTPEAEKPFGKAVGLVFSWLSEANISAHSDKCDRVIEVADIPGCNAFYKREILEKVMPFDESLLTAEDAEFNFRIRQLGYSLLRVPDVVLVHHRRLTAGRLWKQFYRFAIGRLQAGRKHRGLLSLFHILAGFSLPLLIVSLAFFSFFLHSLFIAGILLALLAGTLLTASARTRSLSTALNFLFVVPLIMIAWSLGFLRELFFPIKEVSGR